MRDLEIRTYTTYSIYDSDGEFISGPFETQEALDAELKRLVPPQGDECRMCGWTKGTNPTSCGECALDDWDGMPNR